MGYNKNLNLPYDIPANEYLRLEGEQFSKSRGIAVWVPDIVKNLEVDSVRYYLSINMPENKDTNWVWTDFVAKNNDELVGAYGNFVHRVITFTNKNFGEIPDLDDLDNLDKEAIDKIKETSENVKTALSKCQFKIGLRETMNLAQFGNKYFNQKQPWKLIKTNKNACANVLHICLKIINALAIFSHPYLPFSSNKIWAMLGYNSKIEDETWGAAFNELKIKKPLERPKPLFKKLDIKDLIKEEKKDPFSKVDLRVAKILDVKDHPNADSLYMIHLDLGKLGKRVIVAGMKPYYKINELKDKKIVIVVNLKPAKIRGIKSNGMLLAAEDDEGTVSLLDPKDSTPGSDLFVDGIKKEPANILEFDEFKKLKLKIGKNQKAMYNDNILKCEKGDVKSDKNIKKGAKIL